MFTETSTIQFQLLGITYFVLLMFWLGTLGKDIWSRYAGNELERYWIYFSLVSGVYYALSAGIEWGLPFAGTALSLGLCISVALMHSSAAASLLASSLFLRPWEIVPLDPYLSVLPRLSFVFCLAHLFLDYAKMKSIKPIWSLTSVLIILFTGWCFNTTFFSMNGSSAQQEFFDGFIKSIFLYLTLIQMIRTRDALQTLVVTLLLSFLYVGSISIIMMEDSRLTGFGAFTNSNDIAALMVLILPFGLFPLLKKTRTPLSATLDIALTLIAFTSVILSRSRGALLGVAAMAAVYFILRLGKKAWVPLVVGISLLAIPATIFISSRSSDDLSNSSAGRKTYLKAGLRMGVTNPIFGVGFNSYPANLQNYSTESLEESKQMTAHNSWILVFAETGPIGLFLFCAIFYRNFLSAWKIYRDSPEYLLSLIGYGVAIFFLSHSYLIYPYLLFALIQSAYSSKPEPTKEVFQ